MRLSKCHLQPERHGGGMSYEKENQMDCNGGRGSGHRVRPVPVPHFTDFANESFGSVYLV